MAKQESTRLAQMKPVDEVVAPKPQKLKKWPNVGRYVYTDPNDTDYERRRYYNDAPDGIMSAPREWQIVNECVHTIDLVATKALPGRGFKETKRIRKNDHSAMSKLYDSEAALWDHRLECMTYHQKEAQKRIPKERKDLQRLIERAKQHTKTVQNIRSKLAAAKRKT